MTQTANIFCVSVLSISLVLFEAGCSGARLHPGGNFNDLQYNGDHEDSMTINPDFNMDPE